MPLDTALTIADPFLTDLQGGLVTHHGRPAAIHAFFTLGGDHHANRKFVGSLGDHVTSAKTQLDQVMHKRATGESAGVIMFAFLSATGYAKLGVAHDHQPKDPAFRDGMRKRAASLRDPDPAQWDSPFSEGVDLMVLIAGEARTNRDDTGMEDLLADIVNVGVSHGICLEGIENGYAIRNADRNGIEHFGYVDGRSQPLFWDDDIAKEPRTKWDPRFPPRQFLDIGPGDRVLGSYYVFRKLEQNVQGFKKHEQELANALGYIGEDRERAGAMVVGRFEDGTPVVLHPDAQGQKAVENDFTFAGDPNALRCPFQGHIRKANPRDDISRRFGAPEGAGREHIMARRGITYGVREFHPNTDIPLDNLPDHGVGLLFQAYMKDVSVGFEFTQKSWVNNPDFVAPGTGIDPVIGQGPGVISQWRATPESPTTVPLRFESFVTMKGGEYLYAPTISFLRSLKA